jgi:hypothetical protein
MKTVWITVAGVLSVGNPKCHVNIVADKSEFLAEKRSDFKCLILGIGL